jgi:hypothetical protein
MRAYCVIPGWRYINSERLPKILYGKVFRGKTDVTGDGTIQPPSPHPPCAGVRTLIAWFKANERSMNFVFVGFQPRGNARVD